MAVVHISSVCFFLWIIQVVKVTAENRIAVGLVSLSVASCRASCLDEFVPSLATVENCKSSPDCFMCLRICPMLHEDLHMWGPMCTNQDICFPGCQKACHTIGHKKDIRITSSSSGMIIRSLYDPLSRRIKLIWNPVTESLNSTFYAILLKNHTSKNETWTELAQTTSCSVYINTDLLSHDTDIRVMAANASGQIADAVMTYSDIVKTATMRLRATRDVSIKEHQNGDLVKVKSGQKKTSSIDCKNISSIVSKLFLRDLC